MIHTKCRKTREMAKAKFFIALFVPLFFLAILVSTGLSAPKKVSTAKPGDCAACHESKRVLPPDHPDTKQMGLSACSPCHQKMGESSLRTKMPVSHAHNLAGVTCEKCHGKAQKRQAVEMAKCITCHNPAKLVEKTAKIKPENPHTSPHYGDSLDCNLCHHQHEKSENYCNQCHQFNFNVP